MSDTQLLTTDDVGTVEAAGLVDATPDALGALIAQGGAGKYVNPQALAQVTKVGDWLPYIQLMGGESKEVKKGEFPIGHFSLKANRQSIDLGTEFVGLFLAWRPKAMFFGPPPKSYFDPESDAFKDIEATADRKNSSKGYGPEMFVWLPEQALFATYFLGNKTGRNESPNLIAIVESGKYLAQVKAVVIETAKNTWHGPRTVECDLPVAMPPGDIMVEQLTKFNNPKPAEEELVAEDEEGDSRR